MTCDVELKVSVEIKIPFHDVDNMGVVWHGHYAKYLEIARCALLDKIDYNYPAMQASGYAWPVVDMRIRYPKPLLFEQVILVEAELREYENRLLINYVIRDKNTGQRLTKAYTSQVAVDIANEEMLLASPAALIERLNAYA